MKITETARTFNLTELTLAQVQIIAAAVGKITPKDAIALCSELDTDIEYHKASGDLYKLTKVIT